MAKFIIFSNNTPACFPSEKVKNPFSIMNISTFGEKVHIAAIFNNNSNRVKIIDSPNFNYSGSDILIHIDSVPNLETIESFVFGDKEVYVLLHCGSETIDDKKRKKNQRLIIKKVLGENYDNFIEQSHNSKSIFWNELIDIAMCISSDNFSYLDYSFLLEKLKKHWPNPILEAKLILIKRLIIALKKQNNWEETKKIVFKEYNGRPGIENYLIINGDGKIIQKEFEAFNELVDRLDVDKRSSISDKDIDFLINKLFSYEVV